MSSVSSSLEYKYRSDLSISWSKHLQFTRTIEVVRRLTTNIPSLVFGIKGWETCYEDGFRVNVKESLSVKLGTSVLQTESVVTVSISKNRSVKRRQRVVCSISFNDVQTNLFYFLVILFTSKRKPFSSFIYCPFWILIIRSLRFRRWI